MNLTILYNSTVKFKQTNGKRKNNLWLLLSPFGFVFLPKLRLSSCRPIYLNFRSPRIWPFLMISIFCLWEKYTCFNTFLSLSLKTAHPFVRRQLLWISGWRHPGVHTQGLWKRKQQVFPLFWLCVQSELQLSLVLSEHSRDKYLCRQY